MSILATPASRRSAFGADDAADAVPRTHTRISSTVELVRVITILLDRDFRFDFIIDASIRDAVDNTTIGASISRRVVSNTAYTPRRKISNTLIRGKTDTNRRFYGVPD
jgi:hypothetical protein